MENKYRVSDVDVATISSMQEWKEIYHKTSRGNA